jgi:glycosyltransferase involved in cell wall biosynthesis
MVEHAGPRVSAIIVVFNGEAYLNEAINSVAAQSREDWELLVVDDGSTDSTQLIVRGVDPSLAGKVRLLTHPDGGNHGISASRNRGIAEARGEYVAFLDADDVWLPAKLAEQVAILDADPDLGMIYGRTLIWHSWERHPAREDFCYPLGVRPDERYEPPVLLNLLLENKVQTPTTCNAMIRRSLFERLGRFEDSFRLMFEDQTFFAKALAFAPCYVSDNTWAMYRQHSDSCSAVSAKSGHDEAARVAFLKWLYGALTKQGANWHTRFMVFRHLMKARYVQIRRAAKRRLRR